ncbi:vicilin-like seed storage protein At2g18540 [Hyposmocoma kahamanoa]|uniref:vicilin-like seed storage protein At2g18540 n=1 Tax=Hyposmocoma kahamanoa TaxID=1477025 RepID=UPI000E6DA513|nr:vicilin-like seed storage protein At2g18540 [Hyposmocoma kahamanoa]
MPKNKRPMTAEEIRQKKRECERKRRARIKADPVLYAASKKKDNERYAQKRCKKQVKTVNEMTPRERRIQQRAWRERKARSRSNKKREEQLLQKLKENTPETSADEENRASPTHKVFELALSSPTSSFSSGLQKQEKQKQKQQQKQKQPKQQLQKQQKNQQKRKKKQQNFYFL